MLLGVTACGNKNDTPAADGDNTGTTSTTVLKMGHVYSETLSHAPGDAGHG